MIRSLPVSVSGKLCERFEMMKLVLLERGMCVDVGAILGDVVHGCIKAKDGYGVVRRGG